MLNNTMHDLKHLPTTKLLLFLANIRKHMRGSIDFFEKSCYNIKGFYSNPNNLFSRGNTQKGEKEWLYHITVYGSYS